MKNRLHKLGFTLVELIVVMLVLGILAAVFIPRSNNQAIILSTQAEQLAADIRYVQSLAMTQGWSGVSPATRRPYSLNIIAAGYSFVDGYGVNVPNTSGASSAALAANVRIALPATGLPNNLVSFNGLGKPYADFSAVNTPLAAAATITLVGSTGETRSIQICAETGLVRVTPAQGTPCL